MMLVPDRVVQIVPMGLSDAGLMMALAGALERSFPFSCRIGTDEKMPVDALDGMRGQYHATRVLEHLVASDRTAFRILGVTSFDIFTPILQYIFGEAMLEGRAALVSTYRLGTVPFEGVVPCRHAVFVDRVIKEGIHELGHTFGLTHCDDHNCVMTASLTVGDIDEKSTQMCYYCQMAFKDELARTRIAQS